MSSSLTSDSLFARLEEAEDLPPPPWQLVAETATSLVFDLGDGSLLKAVKKRGGLSSGEARFRREAAALRAMEGWEPEGLRLPQLIAQGECSNGGFLEMPLAGWLRMERLEGRAFSFDAFSLLPSERRDRMGERLGVAIASLHQMPPTQTERLARLGDPVLRQLGLVQQSSCAPQDLPRLQTLESLWRQDAFTPYAAHGRLAVEHIIWNEGGWPAFTGWSEAGASAAESDLAAFEAFGPLRDAVLRGYVARMGARPDMPRYRQAAAAQAFVVLAVEGDQGHPREGMRRRRMLDEYLFQAGID